MSGLPASFLVSAPLTLTPDRPLLSVELGLVFLALMEHVLSLPGPVPSLRADSPHAAVQSRSPTALRLSSYPSWSILEGVTPHFLWLSFILPCPKLNSWPFSTLQSHWALNPTCGLPYVHFHGPQVPLGLRPTHPLPMGGALLPAAPDPASLKALPTWCSCSSAVQCDWRPRGQCLILTRLCLLVSKGEQVQGQRIIA